MPKDLSRITVVAIALLIVLLIRFFTGTRDRACGAEAVVFTRDVAAILALACYIANASASLVP
jgi:hypothetical protein